MSEIIEQAILQKVITYDAVLSEQEQKWIYLSMQEQKL